MTEAVCGKRAPRKAVEIGNSEDQKVHEQRFFLQSKMRAWIVTMTVIAMLMPTRNNGAVAAAAAAAAAAVVVVVVAAAAAIGGFEL